MRAVILTTSQNSYDLAIEELERPEPGAGEVRVKLKSIGLNRADLLYPQGRYFIKPVPNSRIGFEGAGVIDACGPGTHYKVGDKVGICPMTMNVVNQGCLAEYGIYSEQQLLPTPPSVSLDDSGAIWMAYLTAWGGLVDAGGLSSGDHVVITAASSSVGIAAIQLCQQLDAISIATTTSEDKAEILRQAGANHVIVQEKGDEGIQHYVDQVNEITNGKGSDLVFDAVAGPATHGLVKASKRGGCIVIHGLLDRRPMDIHAGVLMKRLLTIKGYTLDQTLNEPEIKAKAVEMITNGFDQGILSPTIAKRFDFVDYQNAFQKLTKNQHIGKIVINL